MFSLICAWINGWVNNPLWRLCNVADDLWIFTGCTVEKNDCPVNGPHWVFCTHVCNTITNWSVKLPVWRSRHGVVIRLLQVSFLIWAFKTRFTDAMHIIFICVCHNQRSQMSVIKVGLLLNRKLAHAHPPRARETRIYVNIYIYQNVVLLYKGIHYTALWLIVAV